MASPSIDEISSVIRDKILIEGLELEEMGFSQDELSDDILLLDPSGVGLDSVDALELVVGIRKHFGIDVGEVDQEWFDEHCKSIGHLAKFVEQQLKAGNAGTA
ncbi:acyl carrier protein [Fodinicurvata sp. EGI_FJ10296]|uniref:acyl carrier protein n=1 Tax=Fodinicurvata sp. EGI_FJ10296 TaxID=3231908 RepID=UPI003451D352